MTARSDGMTVLALNSGSSSLKFGLYRVGSSSIERLVSGEVEAIGGEHGQFHAEDAHSAPLAREPAPFIDPGDAIGRIAGLLADTRQPAPEAIGHRIVHGGPGLRRHCLIDASVVRQLDAATAFAPLHMPAALAVIRAARAQFPGLPQAACFDTAFHADMPDLARVLPIDRDLQRDGVQRYGFHGLSCESILQQLAGDLPPRVIIAHLGAGASVTAVQAGRSIDTSMGLTPTGGVMMGARSGDLDPGLLIYLMREKGFDAARLEALVDHQSGLVGVSGVSADMRSLHDAAGANPDARLAVDMFCSSVRKWIAAMISVLDGVDLIVFTGGIGENDPVARAAICDGLGWIGVRLEDAQNRAGETRISAASSRCEVRVLSSQEDEQIARHTEALTRASRP